MHNVDDSVIMDKWTSVLKKSNHKTRKCNGKNLNKGCISDVLHLLRQVGV